MKRKDNISFSSLKLFLGILALSVLASCSIFKRNSDKEENSKDKKSGKHHPARVTCYKF